MTKIPYIRDSKCQRFQMTKIPNDKIPNDKHCKWQKFQMSKILNGKVYT